MPAVFEPLESRVLLSAEPAGLSAGYADPVGATAVPFEVGLTKTGKADGVTPRNGEAFVQDAPFVTLDATILSEADIPASLISGDSPVISMPVRVTNNGNTAMPAGRMWWVVAELNLEGAELTPGWVGRGSAHLVTETGIFTSALQPGQSLSMNLDFVIPPSLRVGVYQLRVLTDANGLDPRQRFFPDRIELSTQTITVAEPYVELEAAISAQAKLPAAVTAGDGRTFKLPVTVTHLGNVPVDAGRTVDVQVYADRADGGSTLLTTRRNVSLSGLAPGQSTAMNLSLSMPRELTARDYTLRAVVDPSGSVARPASASTTQAIRVAEGFVNLDAAVSDRAKLPEAVIAGDGTALRLPVGITNHGNIAVERGQKIEVAVYAEAADGRLELATRVQGVSLSGLKPGKTKRANLRIQMPQGLTSGDYLLRVEVDPHGEVTQSSTAGNTTWTMQTVRVDEGYVKLDTAVSAKAKLPASVLSGDGTKIRLPISITNQGNVAVEKRQKMDVAVYADRAGGGSTLVTTVESVSVSGLKPGKAKKLNLKVQLPIGLTDGDYTLRVVADASGEVAQSTTAGNTARTADAIRVTEGVMAFELAILDQTRLPTTVESDGAAKIKLPVSLTNSGNVSLPRGQRVLVMVNADRAGGSPSSILIARGVGVSLSGLKPGKVKKTTLSFEMPPGLRNGDYTLSLSAFTTDSLSHTSTAYAATPFTVNDYAGPDRDSKSGAICFCDINSTATLDFFLGQPPAG